MSDFWRMLVGPTPGECVNTKLGNWINGEYSAEHDTRPKPTPQASDAALKIARAIEQSTGRWAFEDDQGHAHCYGLGITVSFGPSAKVWQGARDQNVHGDNVLLESPAHSADAIVISDALTKRRARYKQEQLEAAQRAKEAENAARAKRLDAALEKLGRGECLEDPDDAYRSLGRYARSLGGPSPVPQYLNPYLNS